LQELNTILIGIILIDFFLLATGRLSACINATALQGAILGVTILMVAKELAWHTALLAVGMIGIKGVIVPRLLFRAIRQAKIRREVEPLIGFTTSMLIGILMVFFSFWMASRLSLPIPTPAPLLLPAAFTTLMTGLLIMVSRSKALTQVVGYLVMENGIFLFGLVLAEGMPFLVEMGILLDVFIAVFVMGIAIYHINQAFDDIYDEENLTTLQG
jgi:hydrogenase-4 component E